MQILLFPAAAILLHAHPEQLFLVCSEEHFYAPLVDRSVRNTAIQPGTYATTNTRLSTKSGGHSQLLIVFP